MNLLGKNSPLIKDLPKGSGHTFLVKFMLAEQQKMFGSTILKMFSYNIIMRNMKLLCSKYDDETIKRGIMVASYWAEHPYSTSFLEDAILWLKELYNSPIQTWLSDQNKS